MRPPIAIHGCEKASGDQLEPVARVHSSPFRAVEPCIQHSPVLVGLHHALHDEFYCSQAIILKLLALLALTGRSSCRRYTRSTRVTLASAWHAERQKGGNEGNKQMRARENISDHAREILPFIVPPPPCSSGCPRMESLLLHWCPAHGRETFSW